VKKIDLEEDSEVEIINSNELSMGSGRALVSERNKSSKAALISRDPS